jgi:hypothetical protein
MTFCLRAVETTNYQPDTSRRKKKNASQTKGLAGITESQGPRR